MAGESSRSESSASGSRQYSGYRGPEGGLVGAYDRVKQRHQQKYGANPNPHRAHYQRPSGALATIPDKGRERLGLTKDELTGLLTLQNKGEPVSEDVVAKIMSQCQVDKEGRLKRTDVGKALQLFVDLERGPSRCGVPAPQAQCCIIS